VLVATESELLFDHVPQDWSGGWSSESHSWPDVDHPSDQSEFDTSDVIRLYRWSAGNAKLDGIVLWLEPRQKWEQRRNAEANASDFGSADKPSTDE
jgi:hypothetical protein